MKRKILVLVPILALLAAGCSPRVPSPVTTTSGTPTTSTTSTSTTSTTTEPVVDTYGTLDNPITVARALEIGFAISGASTETTVFETKDAFIKGIVQTEPEAGDSGALKFDIGDSFVTSSHLQFYYGNVEASVTTPIAGDEVVVFGRIANYKTRTIELASKKANDGTESYEIDPPVVLKANHVDCTITVGEYSHGKVAGVPTETVKNGTTIDLVVTPDAGYYVGSVKAYGQTVTEVEGKYSFVARATTTVSVEFLAGEKSALQEAYEAAIEAGGSETSQSYTFSGVIIGTVGNSFYVQDKSYGIYIYSSAAITGVEVGKLATIKSTLITYNGLVETKNIDKDCPPVIGSSTTLPESAPITSQASLNALNQNVRAHVAEAEFVSKDKEWNSNTSSVAKIKVGDDQINIKFEKYAFNENKAVLYNALTAGSRISFTDVMTTAFYETMQLTFGSTSTIHGEAPAVTSVTVNPSAENLVVGETKTLTAVVLPEGAEDKTVTWSSENNDIVTVTSTGVISAVAAGTTNVVATSNADNKISGKCVVTVTTAVVHVTSVSVTPETLALETTSQPSALTLEVLPTNATDKTVTWETSDDSVATVVNGVVTPHAAGTATITATSNDNDKLSDSCVVTVTASTKTSLQLAYEGAIAGSTDEFTFSGTIVSMNSTSYILQDGEYGINVYKTAPTNAHVGDLVEVVATMKLYNGCPQTNSVKSDTIKGSGTLPTPVTIGSMSDLDALKHNVLVSVETATFKSKNKTWNADTSSQFVFTIGSDDITISFDKKAYSDQMGVIANAAVEGDEFALDNVITSAYSGKNQINFAGTSTITKTSGDIHAESINFMSSSYNVKQGAHFDLSSELVILPDGSVEMPTYSVSGNEHVAITAEGLVSVDHDATPESTATVTAIIKGLTPASCTIVVEEASSSASFVKITSTADLVDGKYLIVCEETSVAFDGSLDKLDVVSNNVSVTISGGNIDYDADLEMLTFTYNSDEKSLKSSSGYFIGCETYKNALYTSSTFSQFYKNNISFDDKGNAIIGVNINDDTVTMKYNKTSNQNRFRYYKSGQTDVQLYLLVD